VSFPKQFLAPCTNCGEPALRIIEVRNTAASVRRRKACDICKHRVTTHEVTQEAFEAAQADASKLHRLRQVLRDVAPAPAVATILCDTCKFNQGHSCAFDLPEYGSSEALDCNLAE